MFLGTSTKNYDNQEHEDTEQEKEENEHESSIDVQNKDTSEMMRIPEITTEELQTAINRLKGKSADSNGIRAEDIKAWDDETIDVVRQIFNGIEKQNEFTPEAWRKLTIKVTKKEKWKMLETTARSVLCPRCTNCSRQYCTADCIQDLIKSKRKSKRDSEALTKQQTILRRTEWLIGNT